MSKSYAVSRMPATFSVIKTLISNLISQGIINKEKIETIFDFGSGTGSGYFALRDIFEGANIELFERDNNMIDIFKRLTGNSVSVKTCDVVCEEIKENADLLISSYVFNELKPDSQKKLFEKMCSLSNEYVLIVDAGNEKNHRSFMELKQLAKNFGYSVIAPCMCDICPIKQPDYCDFFVRVERSSAMRIAKGAFEPYEDERFVYLLLSKTAKPSTGKERIIKRPSINKGHVQLTVCSTDGIKNKIFAKSDGEIYKLAKKSKINDIL